MYPFDRLFGQISKYLPFDDLDDTLSIIGPNFIVGDEGYHFLSPWIALGPHDWQICTYNSADIFRHSSFQKYRLKGFYCIATLPCFQI